MANFGRKMWGWKHSLKGASNTEMKPDVISFPPYKQGLNLDPLTYQSNRNIPDYGNASGSFADYVYWNTGGKFATESDKAFLFAIQLRESTSIFKYPMYRQYLDINVAQKLSYADSTLANQYKCYVSYDIQNGYSDPYPDDDSNHYSSLALSGIAPHTPLNLDYANQKNYDSVYPTLVRNLPFGPQNGQLAGFNAFFGYDSTSAVSDNTLLEYFQFHKTVAGTRTLAASYELSQIKTDVPFNWNQVDGGNPEFELMGNMFDTSFSKKWKTYSNTKISYPDSDYLTPDWDPIGYNSLGDWNILLDNRYAGKTVKSTINYTPGRTYPNMPGPDQSMIVDIAFEIELALQRYGCDYTTHDFTSASSADYTGLPLDEVPDAVPQLSYVAGNFCFYKGGSGQYNEGTHLLIPVYLRAIRLSDQYATGDYPIQNNGHVNKYVMVAIRLEKRYNVGSFIPNSGVVLDLEKSAGTLMEAYHKVLGVDTGIQTRTAAGLAINVIPDEQKHDKSFQLARVRKGQKFVSGTSGYSGEVNPPTCLRISESGKYGFYSGGTIYNGSYTGPRTFTYPDDLEAPTSFTFNDNGTKMFIGDSSPNSGAVYKSKILIYDLSSAYDPSTASNLRTVDLHTDLGIPTTANSNTNNLLCFCFSNYSTNSGEKFWVVTGGWKIYEYTMPAAWDLENADVNDQDVVYDHFSSDGINQVQGITYAMLPKVIYNNNRVETLQEKLYISCGPSDITYTNEIVQYDVGVNPGVSLPSLSSVTSVEKSSGTISSLTNSYLTEVANIFFADGLPSPGTPKYWETTQPVFVCGQDSNGDGRIVQLYMQEKGEIDTLIYHNQAKWESTASVYASRFGDIGDMNDDIIVMGARSTDTPDGGSGTYGGSSGSAFVFDRQTGEELARLGLQSRPRGGFLEFGSSVAVSNDYIAVSWEGNATGTAYNSTRWGAVDIFDATTRAYLRTIYNPDELDTTMPSRYDFGVGGELVFTPDGSKLIVSNGTYWIWIIDPSNGSVIRRIQSPITQSNALFAARNCLAASNSYIVAGSPNYINSGVKGRAYIFNISNGSTRATIENPRTVSADGSSVYPFGQSVGISLNGTYVTVSHHMSDDGVFDKKGAGRLYVYNNSGTFQRYFSSPEPNNGDGLTNSTGESYSYFSLWHAHGKDVQSQNRVLVWSTEGVWQYDITGNQSATTLKSLDWKPTWPFDISASSNANRAYSYNMGYPFYTYNTWDFGGGTLLFDSNQIYMSSTSAIQYSTNSNNNSGSLHAYDNDPIATDLTKVKAGGTTQNVRNFFYRNDTQTFYLMVNQNGYISSGADKTLYVATFDGHPFNLRNPNDDGDASRGRPLLSNISGITASESSHKITRFKAYDSFFRGGEYFWHTTELPNGGTYTAKNTPINERKTLRDPFDTPNPSIQTIDFSMENYVDPDNTGGQSYDSDEMVAENVRTACPGYGPGGTYGSYTYYQYGNWRHDVTNAFIRSFRFSNDGKWLYILWVTNTRIANASDASIEQWVERWWFGDPEGYECSDENFVNAKDHNVYYDGIADADIVIDPVVYFAGTTHKYVIQGDNSGGYLNSATSIDVTPDGKFLQVMQPYSRIAGEENNKPMIVEHYLGGNDMGLAPTFRKPRSSATNPQKLKWRGLQGKPTNPWMYFHQARNYGGSLLFGNTSYWWPMIPCQPGNTSNTTITYDTSTGNFSGGGSTVWAVWDRTYKNGRYDWHSDRSNWAGSGATVFESDSRWVADTDYDIMPSDFSWNREGTVLYMYGAFPEDNNYLNAGGFRRRGMPYMLKAPLYATNNYPGCVRISDSGNRTGGNPRSRYDYLYEHLYTNRIQGFLEEKSLMSPDQDNTSSYDYHACYFLPNDEDITGGGYVAILAAEVQDYSGNYCWEFDGLNVSDTAVINENSEANPVENLIFKKSMVDIPSAVNPPIDLDGVITYQISFWNQTIDYPPEIQDTAGNPLGTSDGVFIEQASASDFANGDGYIVIRVSKDADWTNGGGNSNNSVLLHFASTRPSNGLDAKLYFTETDFLEVCSQPLSWESKHGISTDADYKNFSKPRQSFAINYPTVWDDVPTARRDSVDINSNNWQTTSGGYPTYGNGAMSTDEADAALQYSAFGWTNWSAAFCENPSLQGKTFPMASVFAHHKGGRYLYTIVEDTNAERQPDPVSSVNNFRPLYLAILPIETNIEENLLGDGPLYAYYWGQDTDTGSGYTDYNYLGWGVTENSVDGPRMPASSTSSLPSSVYPIRQWGGMYASSYDSYVVLSYSSSTSFDSNTRLNVPAMQRPYPDGSSEDKYAMGVDSMSLDQYSLDTQPVNNSDKKFLNYRNDQLPLNLSSPNLTERGANVASAPIIEYKGDQSYFIFRDMKGGKFGALWGRADTGTSPSFIDNAGWGINNSNTLSGNANPFLEAQFISCNWGHYDDMFDLPKFTVSTPRNFTLNTSGYADYPTYFNMLQRKEAESEDGSVSDSYYYITQQKYNNAFAINKSAIAYNDYKNVYNSGSNAVLNILESSGLVSGDSYVTAATGSSTLSGEIDFYYHNPRSTDSYGNKNVASVRSFRFMDNGYKLFVLISGGSREINSQITGNAAFTLTKYELTSPYNITAINTSATQSYTFHQDSNYSGNWYDYWWGAMQAPTAYFGADFAMHPDGDKFWVIGLESQRTNPPGQPARPTEGRTILREFTLSTDWDLSTVSENGFANYDNSAGANITAPLEVPVSLEVSPDGNYAYWTQQYGSQNRFDPTSDWGGNNTTGDFAGSNFGESKMRHFKVELTNPYDLKNPIDSSDNKIVETIQGPSGPITRTTRGAYWTADEGAAQRIRFVSEDRWYRTNYASELVRNDQNPSLHYDSEGDPGYDMTASQETQKAVAVNWPIGGVSSYSAVGQKTQKVDGSFSIGNMGMFKNVEPSGGYTGSYPFREAWAPYQMFIFEINPEESVILVSDTQCRIVPLLLNNSTKGI